MAEWDIFTRALEVLDRGICKEQGYDDATFCVVSNASGTTDDDEGDSV